jgi:type II secretory pathway pseudopilin PulG
MKSDKTMRSENTSEIVHDKNEPIKQSALSGRHVALINKIRTRRKQRGFDLIQLGLVVALIGLLMAGAMVGVPKLVENIKTNQQSDDVRIFITQAQAHFALFKDGEISANIARQAKLYPGTPLEKSTDTSVIYPARFSGEVAITYDNTNRKMSLKMTGVPSVAACSKIGSQLVGVDADLKVGDTEIPRKEGRLDLGKLSEACAVGATKGQKGVGGAADTPGSAGGSELTIITKI